MQETHFRRMCTMYIRLQLLPTDGYKTFLVWFRIEFAVSSNKHLIKRFNLILFYYTVLRPVSPVYCKEFGLYCDKPVAILEWSSLRERSQDAGECSQPRRVQYADLYKRCFQPSPLRLLLVVCLFNNADKGWPKWERQKEVALVLSTPEMFRLPL